MSELTDNINLFQPTGFRVLIDRANYGNLQFFAQSISHPGVNIGPAEVPYQRLTSIPIPGDKLSFGEVTMNILLDEDLNAYEEVFNWMVRLVNTKFTTKYEALKEGTISSYADITLIALTNHNNKNKTIKYVDCIPTSIGDIYFEANQGSVEYITVPVGFRFSYFEID